MSKTTVFIGRCIIEASALLSVDGRRHLPMSRGRNGLRLKTLKYNLELTSRCNLLCGMCPMDEIDRPYEDAPWWMVEKIAAEMKDLGLHMRYLHELGEPL